MGRWRVPLAGDFFGTEPKESVELFEAQHRGRKTGDERAPEKMAVAGLPDCSGDRMEIAVLKVADPSPTNAMD
ncbi:MAG: hypothetical protein LC131_07295 [Anaerolineae bacterium]|nr:hypothetical protein [Anaerolineae bacterium]